MFPCRFYGISLILLSLKNNPFNFIFTSLGCYHVTSFCTKLWFHNKGQFTLQLSLPLAICLAPWSALNHLLQIQARDTRAGTGYQAESVLRLLCFPASAQEFLWLPRRTMEKTSICSIEYCI